MMPSVGLSMADSTSQTAGGSPVYNPQRSMGFKGKNKSDITTSWSPTTTSEATAKTDMGGGLPGLGLPGLGGGGGGGSSGGGFGLGGIVSGIAGAFGLGGKSGAAGAGPAGAQLASVGGGASLTPLLIVGGLALIALVLLTFALRKD